MKKQIAPFFLTIVAYALILGHSIIPHHHHDSYSELTAHHLTGHEHEHEGLGHLFSHFVHPDDGVTFTANHSITGFSKQVSFNALFVEVCFSGRIDLPPPLHSPPAETPIYFSPHSRIAGLRAPPSFLA